jgi:LuxR family maltose regulon positive regulatory protein
MAQELSPGELRVLRYLPTYRSRPEIVGELSISLNTVNTHLRGIFAKLGAEDRSAAVHRARELRLLSAPCSLSGSLAEPRPRLGCSLLPSGND